jgi:hypothetical protein
MKPTQLLIEDPDALRAAIDRARKAWLHKHGEKRSRVASEFLDHAQKIRLEALNAALFRAGHEAGDVVQLGDVLVLVTRSDLAASIVGRTLPQDEPEDALNDLDDRLRVEQATLDVGSGAALPNQQHEFGLGILDEETA